MSFFARFSPRFVFKANPELIPLAVPVAAVCSFATYMCWHTLFNAADIQLTADESSNPRYSKESFRTRKLISEPLDLAKHTPRIGWFGVYPKERNE